MAKTKPNRPSKAPEEPLYDKDKAIIKYQRELIARARDFYKNRNLGDGVSGEKYFNSLNNEQKMAAGKLLQFRENNFDDLGFTKDGLGERSPLFGKRFSDEQFIKMFDRDKGFYGPGLREGDTGEGYLFRPGNEPVFDFYAEGKLGYVYRPDDPRIFDYLGFPKEAKTQHDQYDEKGRMKMQQGGTIAEQIYGQRRTTPYSMNEYLSGSMYDFPGIDVDVAPAAGQPETVEEDTGPNILMPVSERGDDPSQLFRGVSLQSGKLGTGYNIGTLDPADYLADLVNQESFTIKEDGFSKYAQQQFIKGGGAATAAASLATGMPLTVLGAGAAALAAKQTKKNVQAMVGTNGGDLFTLNGATVSRAPGSKIFTGNLGGFSQGQLYASREIDFGFIPGSMVEGDKRTGNSGVAAAGKVSGHIMDAYGRIHGLRDESGAMQVGAIAAQRMRENEFRQNMIAAGLSAELAAMEADGTFTMNAVRAKQYTDKAMRAGQGFRFRASNVPADEYKKALANRTTTYQNFLDKKYGAPDEVIVPSAAAQAQTAPSASDDRGDSGSGGIMTEAEPMVSGGINPEDIATDVTEQFDFDDDFARGGRVGMQAGGEATFEPGFVEGPPENFTERETVADDQNGKVAPDTFIINAAAVEIAGSEDIRKMLMKAYEVAVEKGLDIGRVDRKLYEGTVDVALSKGEVVVPPELAKIIGYDRLRKINNRGKKEVTSRQKKAGGGFLDGKKLANGGEAPKTLPKRKPKKEALADVELRADLEEFIKDDNLARLGFSLYESGDLKLIGMPLRRGIEGATASGQYFPKQGEDQYPEYPSGVKKVANPADASFIVKDRASAAGFIMDQEGEEKAPTAVYFSEPMPLFDADRASVFITLAHELRHAALNHLANEYGVPQETVSTEERVMDFYDEKARREASKKNKSVDKKFSPESLDIDKTSAKQIPKYAKKHDMYEEIAGLVLKERGYPERAVRKGRLKRFIDSFLK